MGFPFSVAAKAVSARAVAALVFITLFVADNAFAHTPAKVPQSIQASPVGFVFSSGRLGVTQSWTPHGGPLVGGSRRLLLHNLGVKHVQLQQGCRMAREPRLACRPKPAGVRGLTSKIRQEALDAITLDLLKQIFGEEGEAEKLLKKRLRELSDRLPNDQRAMLSRRVLGVTVLRERLKFIVDWVDVQRMTEEEPVWFQGALGMLKLQWEQSQRSNQDYVNDLLATYILHEEFDEKTGKFVNGTIGFLSQDRFNQLRSINPQSEIWNLVLDEDSNDVVSLAAASSMPQWLFNMWASQIADPTRSHGGLPLFEVFQLAASCNKIAPVSLRVNLLKLGGRTALIQALAAEGVRADYGKQSPWAVTLKNGRPESGIWSLASWKAGFFEVQDEGSQLIAVSTEAQPGDTVLDYCAGNGGKTLALASMMNNLGKVIAYDVDARRLAQLRGSLERASVACVETVESLQDLEADPALTFDNSTGHSGVDVVLVDAPCSSTGVLRRHPSLRWRLTLEEVQTYPDLQFEILSNASKHVRQGGGLVYATCAINREENEGVADRFSEAFGPEGTFEFEQWPFEVRGSNRRALLPHVHDTDGFFIARWRRRKPLTFEDVGFF